MSSSNAIPYIKQHLEHQNNVYSLINQQTDVQAATSMVDVASQFHVKQLLESAIPPVHSI